MDLPKLESSRVSGKKVLLRLDLDVDDDYSRLEMAEETLDFLVKNKARTIIIGHRGRPEGKVVGELSLAPLAEVLGGVVGEKVNFVYDIVGVESAEEIKKLADGNLLMLENLRFDSREETNDEGFAKSLASLAEFYVNEAIAVSHRVHASIVGVPKFLPHAAGFRFIKEVENLAKVTETPKRPVVLVIGGTKKDKMEHIENFTKVADKILVGGRLPEYYGDTNPNPEKIMIGGLLPDKEDLTLNTVEKFKEEIAKAGTIIVAGVPGKYEDEGHRQGTKEIFEAVAESNAFKLAGGGDAEAAITLLGLNEKFDWISAGGGSMLEFLAKGTLPGIEALLG